MSHQETCIFSSHPEANTLSFQCFLALSDQENTILSCLEGHIFPLINEGICEILERREDQEPFRVLSAGSGEGQNDINILKALTDNSGRLDGQAISMVNQVVEPHVGRLDKLRLKTENLHGHFENGANIDFEWIPLTYQKYKSQKKADDDISFDLIHFTHSIYYVGVEEALVHCYEKELGEEGIIISIAQSEDDPMLKFARKFPNQRSPSFPRNRDVVAVAEQRGWNYFACPGDCNILDITDIFDSSSIMGNYLLDFLTNEENVRLNEDKETVEKILKFWKRQSYINEDGRRIVGIMDNAVIILKGFDHIKM